MTDINLEVVWDLANLAVIRIFPTGLAFIDIAWGSFVTAAESGFSYWIVNKMS